MQAFNFCKHQQTQKPYCVSYNGGCAIYKYYGTDRFFYKYYGTDRSLQSILSYSLFIEWYQAILRLFSINHFLRSRIPDLMDKTIVSFFFLKYLTR